MNRNNNFTSSNSCVCNNGSNEYPATIDKNNVAFASILYVVDKRL